MFRVSGGGPKTTWHTRGEEGDMDSAESRTERRIEEVIEEVSDAMEELSVTLSTLSHLDEQVKRLLSQLTSIQSSDLPSSSVSRML